MASRMKKIFAQEMSNLEAAGLLRHETPCSQTEDMMLDFGNGKRVLNFIGNDVLGWRFNDEVRQVAEEITAFYSSGSTASRASIGTTESLLKLESKLSEFLGVDDCMVFSSHYLANIGLLDPLTNEHDTIFIDEMSSAGLIDGSRLSMAKVIAYRYLDYDNLEYHLKCSQNSRFRLIVTDGVFESDMACADLNMIHYFKETYDAINIIDDSLGLGILADGFGTVRHQSVAHPDLLVSSFTYALGNVSGAFIAGDKDLIDWLRQRSRSYLLAEPLPSINAAIAHKAIELLEADKTNLDILFDNSTYLKQELMDRELELVENKHPFISLVLGSTIKVQKTVQYLFERDILVSGLSYPHAPEGAARLRINLSAHHSKAQIDELLNALDQALREVERSL